MKLYICGRLKDVIIRKGENISAKEVEDVLIGHPAVADVAVWPLTGPAFAGAIADRFGRRKPLLIGLGLYSLASLACAFAPSIGTLIAARFVQAIGGCSGMVIARAMVRDRHEGPDMARVLSALVLVMGVAPVLAPLAGGPSTPEVLKAVVHANQNRAGIYGTVIRTGRVAVGQVIRLRR